MDALRAGIDEVRHDAMIVRQFVQRGVQSGFEAPHGVGRRQETVRRSGRQSQGDEAHARRRQAAQSAGPARTVIALAVEHQAVAGLILQEIR